MTNTMTPSEIADWHRGIADFTDDAKRRYFHRKAAATIRAQAEQLKIATEALGKMVALYESEHDPENMKRPQWLVDALASMKEVG